MNIMMMQVKTTANKDLNDDQFVAECMDMLMTQYPQIVGYQFERIDHERINIMMWGDINVVGDDYMEPPVEG